MNQPAIPAMTATIVPASSALTMNGYAVSCWKSDTGSHDRPAAARTLAMVVASMPVAVVSRGLRDPGHDQPSVLTVEHVDRDAVQLTQRVRRDHLVGRAHR